MPGPCLSRSSQGERWIDQSKFQSGLMHYVGSDFQDFSTC